jgi:hypothetical protein
MLDNRVTIPLAVAAGVALELGIHALTGRREAWDSGAYWTIGLPIVFGVSFAIGVLARGRAWLSTWLIVPAQVLTMMVRGGELGGLWPLAVALSACLSVPFVGAAFVGTRFSRRSP